MIAASPVGTERVTGVCDQGRPGPLLIALGGVHGNEPAGVVAARRVLADLARMRTTLRGRFVAIAGNLGALERGVRYLDADLNRIWTREALRPSPGGAARFGAETAEQLALASELERELELAGARAAGQGAQAEVVLLDLHSTSGDGPPFSVIGDTLRNRHIAFALCAPVILGLEENLEGTLLSYFADRGHAAIGYEGGQNERESTVEHHESAIWLALVAAGLVAEPEVPDLARHRGRLRSAAAGLPPVVELVHRHALAPGEDFRMEPGFVNFQSVTGGQLLAHHERSPVRARQDAILLLPRYQGQGLDGFFLARSVRPVWLAVSRALRKLRLERALGHLPGVQLVDDDGQRLVVNTRVARFLALQIFHLLGYRRLRKTPGSFVFERRREWPDLAPGR